MQRVLSGNGFFFRRNGITTLNAVPDPPHVAKFWRIHITQSSSGEAQFTQYAGIAELYLMYGGVRQLGGTAAARDQGGGAASNAFDGNTGTQWADNNRFGPSWLSYEFPTPTPIDQLGVHHGNQVPIDFTLQTSPNGTAWTTVLTVTGHTGNPNPTWWTVPPA